MPNRALCLFVFLLTLGSGCTTPAPTDPLAGTVSIQVGARECSGSIVRFEDSLPASPALVLTAGHCFPNLEFDREPRVFSTSAGLTVSEVLYASVTERDVAVLKLTETYDELEAREIGVLTLASSSATPGTMVEIRSGFFSSTMECSVDGIADGVSERFFVGATTMTLLWNDVIRTDCDVAPGWSGSPLLEVASDTIVGVVHTVGTGRVNCAVNDPCELDGEGNPIENPGRWSYANPIFELSTCRDAAGEFDPSAPGCALPPSL